MPPIVNPVVLWNPPVCMPFNGVIATRIQGRGLFPEI
jgi:hypothetical protein